MNAIISLLAAKLFKGASSQDVLSPSIKSKAFGSKTKKIYYPKSDADVRFFSIFGSPIAHPSVFGYTNLFKNFSYNLVPAEDYDLWSRMLIQGIKMGNMEDTLLNYRVHGNQITKDLMLRI